MSRQKIFGIGFHKTATSSLGAALSKLGHDVCGPVGVSNPDVADVALDLAVAHVSEHDAFQDNPWPVLYKELDSRYSEAKFILTTRPASKWIQSVSKQFGGNSTPMREWIYGVGDPIGNEDLYLERYNRHNQEVRKYFSDRPDDFIELRITEGDGWEKLCRFLDHPVPGEAFPRVNRAKLRPIKKIYRSSPDWMQKFLRVSWHQAKKVLS
jgi:hypothetical protein